MPPSTVLVIVGSRPEAIKLAPVVFALREAPERFETVICSTGQQRHLIPQALAQFGLAPALELDVMREDQTLADLTSRLVSRLDPVLGRIKPDWVLVQGDTTSAMAGGLCAFYRQIPVGHVEAGLRTDDRRAPFPEEVNRRIITQCADLHFAPTERAAERLRREGVPVSRIRMTGNTVVDALMWMRARIRRGPSVLPASLLAHIAAGRLLLVTMHRRESFGEGMGHICDALLAVMAAVDDLVIALPVHPNPHVQSVVRERLGDHPRIALIEPQPYRALVELMDRAYLVITDSGGLQEEAPAFGTPVLVLRATTERPEGVDAGVARLVGTDRDRIVDEVLRLVRDGDAYRRMSSVANPYGDGTAARRIVSALVEASTHGGSSACDPLAGEWQPAATASEVTPA
jgi:UDP-N-acetylglucosamine 2-epimerase